MEPTNKAQRSKAFWNFLLLFIITIIIITTTIFFSIQVPFRQNDQLVEQMAVAKKERNFSERFMSNMSEISAMLDTINTKTSNQEIFHESISSKITKLSMMVDADSGANKIDYTNAVLTLSNLRDSKKLLRENASGEQQKAELKYNSQVLKKSLDSALQVIIEKDKQIRKMM